MPTLYAPPSLPVFPPGYGPVPADFNNWVQAPFGFQTQGILFRAERHASQSLSTGNNVIDYDTVLEDPYGAWNAGTFKWVAPYPGWYEVTVTSTISVAGMTIASLIITTAATVAGPEFFTGTSYPGMSPASQMLPLIAGQSIQGGTNVSAAATTNTVNGRYSTIEISYVSQ